MPEAPGIDRPTTPDTRPESQSAATSPTVGAENTGKVAALKRAIKGLRPFAALKRIASGNSSTVPDQEPSQHPQDSGQEQQQTQSNEPASGKFRKFVNALNQRSEVPFAEELQRMNTQEARNQSDTPSEGASQASGSDEATQSQPATEPEDSTPAPESTPSANAQTETPTLQVNLGADADHPDTEGTPETTTQEASTEKGDTNTTDATANSDESNISDSTDQSNTGTEGNDASSTDGERDSISSTEDTASTSEHGAPTDEPGEAVSSDAGSEVTDEAPADTHDETSPSSPPDSPRTDDVTDHAAETPGESPASDASTDQETQPATDSTRDAEEQSLPNPEEDAFLKRIQAEAESFGLDPNSEKGKAFIEIVTQNPEVLEQIDKIKDAMEILAGTMVGKEGAKEIYQQIPDLLQKRIDEAMAKGDTEEVSKISNVLKTILLILAGGTLLAAGVSIAGVGVVTSGMGANTRQ